MSHLVALSFRLSPLLLEHSSLPEFSLDALPVGLPNALVVTSTIPVTDDLGTSAVSFKIDPAVSITRAGANQSKFPGIRLGDIQIR